MDSRRSQVGAREFETRLEEALSGLVAQGVLGGEIRQRPPLADFEPIALLGTAISEDIHKDRGDRF